MFDISERQRLQAQLRELAYADALTGLPNRRRFMDAAALEVTRARRQGTPLSLLLLDVDHFKRINDELGHPTGDAVLQALGQLLQRLNRANDVAGRIGGEEFAVLLPGADGSAAAAVAERLRQAVSALQVLPPAAAVPQTPVRLTVSLGVATWRSSETWTAVGGLAEGEAAMEVGRLLKLADQALYAAKA
ncbi:MAG: GGDEF domain-containing protein, partial [Xanthomonadales bacterium]|nr:GGDEF domain-containing protein [Xanthomonadales bacterium]